MTFREFGDFPVTVNLRKRVVSHFLATISSGMADSTGTVSSLNLIYNSTKLLWKRIQLIDMPFGASTRSEDV